MANPTQPQLDKFTINVDRMDSFINDDAATTVPVDSGTIPTLSGTVEEIETTGQAAIDTFNTDSTTAIDTFNTDSTTALDTFESNGDAAIDSLKSYNVTGAWATGTSYNVKDVAEEAGVQYLCLEDHVSGTFATDLANKKWTVFVLDFSSAPLNVLGDLYVDDNLGVGTTSPGHKLTVIGDSTSSPAGVPAVWLHNGNNVVDTDGVVISTINDGEDVEVLHVRTNNTTYNNGRSLLVVKGDGYVGIRRENPEAYLHVDRGDTSLGDAIRISKGSNASQAWLAWSQGAGASGYWRAGFTGTPYDLTFNVGTTTSLGLEVLRLTTDGKLGIGKTAPSTTIDILKDEAVIQLKSTGSGKSSGLVLDSDTADTTIEMEASNISVWTQGMDRSNSNTYIWSNGGALGSAPRMALTTGGDLGVGTTSPFFKLEVEGDFRVGDAGIYNKLIFKTGVPFGIYEGVFDIYPSTIPGSGLAEQLTYFRSNSNVGETRHDVAIEGRLGLGTTAPQTLLDVAGTSRSSVNSSIVLEISDVNDFPAPSGGVISLAANTTYIIRGVVDLGANRLSITQEGIKLMGFSLERDTLTTDTTGSLITTQEVSLEIAGLTLTATNSSSTILTATNYTAGQYNNGRDKDLIIQNCQIRDCYNVWDINGYDLVDCQNVRIRYVKATTHGCKFRSTSKIQITSCELIRWFDESSLPTPSGYATVPMIEFDDNAGQSGFGAVNITGCVIHPQQTQDGIFINANSTTGFGTISSNTFVTIGLTTGTIFNPTPASGGYSLNSTKTYDIFTNQGLRNSSASILTTVTGNTTNTALSTGVPAIMNVGGNAITRNSQRFSATNNAVITYNGSKDIYVSITASVNFDKQGGGADDYEFYLYKDTGSGFVLLPGSKASIGDIGGATFDQLSLTYADTASPGDQYAIFIENPASGDDMRVTDLQFGIKE